MMNSSQKKKIRNKLKYIIIWIIISFFVWLIYCDAEARTEIMDNIVENITTLENIWEQEEEYAEDNWSKKETWYLNRQLEEYCMAVSMENNKDYDTATEDVENTAENQLAENMDNITVDKDENLVEAMNSLSSLSHDKLSDYDYITSNYYNIDSTTNLSRDELDGEKLADMDMTIDTASEDYKILIYHTHGTESFSDSKSGDTSDTVIGVGAYLAELLEESYGIKVYHDTTVYDMRDGVLDRSTAYDYAREGVSAILEQYPSIEVVIDIHRDGVAEDTRLVTDVNGKSTAKLMFLNGISRLNRNGDIDYLPNPYRMENLAFSLQMYLTAIANYDSLMRKIFIKGYRYNLDLAERSLLVEVGSQTNTVEEAKNAMEPLAAILYKVLSGD
jgi:stage II sporulation protein P